MMGWVKLLYSYLAVLKGSVTAMDTGSKPLDSSVMELWSPKMTGCSTRRPPDTFTKVACSSMARMRVSEEELSTGQLVPQKLQVVEMTDWGAIGLSMGVGSAVGGVSASGGPVAAGSTMGWPAFYLLPTIRGGLCLPVPVHGLGHLQEVRVGDALEASPGLAAHGGAAGRGGALHGGLLPGGALGLLAGGVLLPLQLGRLPRAAQ